MTDKITVNRNGKARLAPTIALAIFGALLAGACSMDTNEPEPTPPKPIEQSSSSQWTPPPPSPPLSSSQTPSSSSSKPQSSSSSKTTSGGTPDGIPSGYTKIDETYLYLLNVCTDNKNRDNGECIPIENGKVGVYTQSGDWPYDKETFYIATTDGKVSRETYSKTRNSTEAGQYVPCIITTVRNPNVEDKYESAALLPSKAACDEFKSR